MSKITPEEQKELVRLIEKLELPLPLDVFYAWQNVFASMCAEILLVREKDNKLEVFLEYREDKFFKGWHIQGRIHMPPEKIEDTLNRVIRDEVQASVTTPEFFGWFEHPKGKEINESPRGHAFALVYIARPKEMPKENGTRKFFPINEIPKDILPEHVPVIVKLRDSYKN